MSAKVDLTGKVAVVTGGGGILCSTMAKALAGCGAKVAILDLKQESAQKVADEITAAGGAALGLGANVLDIESLKAAEKQIATSSSTAPAETTRREQPPPKNLRWKTLRTRLRAKFRSLISIPRESDSCST